MAKPIIKFKTYRQAAAVGGKIYGVPNLGDPVVAEVTMQEVIDYAKLHNYSADTLSALLSQVIAGVGDLVARDGRPRMLSDLLKFEPVIKGTFDNLEQTVTNQKILVRPRMLKEIKLKLDPSNYAWQNENDGESPRLISVAPTDPSFDGVSIASWQAALTAAANAIVWTYAGSRLAPNGFEASLAVDVVLTKRVNPTENPGPYHFGFNSNQGDMVGTFGLLEDSEYSSNVVTFGKLSGSTAPAWREGASGAVVPVQSVEAETGDILTFSFTRTLANGDTVTVQKAYTL